MKRILTLSILFNVSASFAKENLCTILKETTNYNHYVKRIERIFKDTISKEYYNISTFKHDSSFESLSQTIKEIKNKNCKIIFGGISSSDSLKILKLLSDDSILFVTPTSSSIELKKIHKNLIYMSLDDNHIINSLFRKTKDLKEKIIIYRNLSYPNTNYIASQLFNRLKSNRNDVEIIDIIKGQEIILSNNQLESPNIIVPSYEQDLIKVHNLIKTTKKRTIYGIDGWGTNISIFNKFAKNDHNFRAIKLDYWNSDVCKSKNFSKICEKYSRIYPEKGFDAFMAIAYDSAIYLNSIKDRKNFKNFMTIKEINNGRILKDPHFYYIDKNKLEYLKEI